MGGCFRLDGSGSGSSRGSALFDTPLLVLLLTMMGSQHHYRKVLHKEECLSSYHHQIVITEGTLSSSSL